MEKRGSIFKLMPGTIILIPDLNVHKRFHNIIILLRRVPLTKPMCSTLLCLQDRSSLEVTSFYRSILMCFWNDRHPFQLGNSDPFRVGEEPYQLNSEHPISFNVNSSRSRPGNACCKPNVALGCIQCYPHLNPDAPVLNNFDEN